MSTRLSLALTAWMTLGGGLLEASAQALPAVPLVIRDFTLQFDPAGTFSLTGAGWPAMAGTWTAAGNEVSLQIATGPKDCTGPGRYTFAIAGAHVSFALVADDCKPRQMILDKSNWLPRGVEPPRTERRIVRTAGTAKGALPKPVAKPGAWPSFRGPEAAGVADGQNLPDEWNPGTGANILWRTSDCRPGSLQSRCLGRPGVRDERRQQQGQRHVQAGPLRRRRCLRRPVAASMGAVGGGQANGQASLGADGR